jgi:hypothetical protein
MADTTSPETIRALAQAFADQRVLRPMRANRYEQGDILEYEVRGVIPDGTARVALEVEKYAGGGYAGQVYRVRLISLETIEGRVSGLELGRSYALKLLVPASGLGRRIRNLFYGIGFQAAFSLQSLASAGRSQALWQKFIRRAAKAEFGADAAVVDIHASLLDRKLGSYGEISEWVDGRMWRLEVDDDLDARRRFQPGDPESGLGSPEYRTKYDFMGRLVRLLNEIGAEELARQYEWWSLKSQPNAMKRITSDPDPRTGLVAVDFRAGMTLLPFLPECPADVKLIIRGIGRGRLVQFDKGDIGRLEAYVERHAPDFADLRPALEELKSEDRAYRDSLIDITYHHVRLASARLRRSIMAGFRESWRVRNLTDDGASAALTKSGALSLLFLLLGLAPLATPALLLLAWPGTTWWKYPIWAVPLMAPFFRRLWGRADLRRHYGRLLTSSSYVLRSVRAHIAETLIGWVRSGRVSEPRARLIVGRPWQYFLHLPLSVLPAGLHRFLTDKATFKAALAFIFIRPFRLYFNAAEREKWLLDMIAQGEKNQLLSREASRLIASQIKEPFIQKYLKSLAVHVCTLPITQIVSVSLAIIYVRTHPELTWKQASVAAGMILALFQVTPVSPGSFARGLYTTFLVMKERNFKDYRAALSLSYLKYIGYLAFPIQMAYRYPDLARFMASHWATGAVHIVPVFGEKGAWLEHFVFDTFYNLPLTVQRRMKRRAEIRQGRPQRAWHIPVIALAGTALLGALSFGFFNLKGALPRLGDIWWLAVWMPFFAAWLSTRWAGGASVGRRIAYGIICGIGIGICWAVLSHAMPGWLPGGSGAGVSDTLGKLAIQAVWQAFIFGLISALSGSIAETRRV